MHHEKENIKTKNRDYIHKEKEYWGAYRKL